MAAPTTLILTLLLLKAVTGYFDCRRQGLTCVAGGCTLVDGNCACPRGINGTDCGYNTTSVNDTACTPSCENGGTCLAEPTGTRCYCPEIYTGKNCEKRRAEVQCTGANMTITVSPYPGFRGVVHVQGQLRDTACTFDKLQDGDGVDYFEKTFDLDVGCGAVVRNDTPQTGDRTFEREIILQYNPNVQTALDQLVNISCVHKAKELTTLNSNVDHLLIENRGNLSLDNTSSEYSPVSMKIQDVDGTALHGPVFVGRPLRLYFYLTDQEVYENIRVESCVAKNSLTGTDEKNETIIKDSCREPGASQIVRGEMEQDEHKSIIIKFDVFKFVDSSVIEFYCTVRVCKPGDTRCDPKNCKGEQNGYGRRKRDTPPAEKDHVIVKNILHVTDIDRGTTTLTGSAPHAHECLQLREILTMIIILSCAVIVFMTATCCLTLAVIKRKPHQKTVSTDTLETEVSSAGSPSSSGRMRIPRIRVWY